MRLFRVDGDDKFTEYQEEDFKGRHQEHVLEACLESNPQAILEDGSLLVIGRQVTTNLGSSIDLLALDQAGSVVVLELKRDRTPRETLAQALEYASFAAGLDHEQIEQILRDYTGDEGLSLAEYHRHSFRLAEDTAVSFNKDQRIVIVGQEITPAIRQTAGCAGVHCPGSPGARRVPAAGSCRRPGIRPFLVHGHGIDIAAGGAAWDLPTSNDCSPRRTWPAWSAGWATATMIRAAPPPRPWPSCRPWGRSSPP